MKLSAFEHLVTYKGLADSLAFLKAYSEEHMIPFTKTLEIEGFETEKLTYLLSSVRNDILVQNFFEYSRDSLKGLYYGKSASTDLHKLTEPNYVKFIFLHNRVWLCLKPDATYDLFVNEQFVTDGIVNYDDLDLCGYVHFVQLDFNDHKSLIVCEGFDAINGIYLPKSKSDFCRYFSGLVETKGYEGKFDSLRLSEVFQIYYEVRNCIFESSKFKPLKEG